MKLLGSLLAFLLLLGGAATPAVPVAAQTSAGLSALLPAASAIPVANAEITDGTQDLFTIAATFPDAALAMRDLQQWGFQENVWRDYASSWWEDPYLPDRAEVSLHRFRTAAGGEAALPAYAAARAAALGLTSAAKPPAGEHSLLLSGTVDGGNEDTIYVAAYGILARVTVVSPAGDPYPWAKKITRSLQKSIAAAYGPVAPLTSAAPAAPAATAATGGASVPGGSIAIPGAVATGVPSTTGNVAISNPPAAPVSAGPSPALQKMLDTLRDESFTVEKVGEDICCVSFAEATNLGMPGEVGTLYFRAETTGYISHLTPSLRYTVFEDSDAAAAAWRTWTTDRKEYLSWKEFENPAAGEPPAIVFTATGRGDTVTATGFMLAGNVIITSGIRSSDWQALLPSIAERNANSLLLAGYKHLLALFGS